MAYYFAWAALDAVFDPAVHAREDVKVFHFEISQEESALAQMTGSLCQTCWENWENQKLFVSHGSPARLLFTGVPVDAPLPQDGIQEVTFVAYHPQGEADIQKIVADHKASAHCDDLFTTPDSDELADVLDALPVVVHWNRLTGRVGLSNLVRGDHGLDLSGKIWDDRVKISQVVGVVGEIHLRVQAQWIQRATGFLDMGPAIDQAFGGRFSSFNQFTAGAGWPSVGTVLGNSGYYIYESRLDTVAPGLGHSTQSDFPRHWYRPTLGVLWSFHQPRRESVTVTLKQERASSLLPRVAKRLTLNLQPVISPGTPIPWRPGVFYKKDVRVFHGGIVYKCLSDHVSSVPFGGALWKDKGPLFCALADPSSASFFLTPRGRSTLSHALAIAQRQLTMAARSKTVTFETNFESAAAITLDHQVRLSISGTVLEGKVVAYTLSAHGDRGEHRAWVKLACCPGGSRGDLPILPDYGDQLPREGIVDVGALMPQDLIAHIDIQGHPEEQRAFLEGPGSVRQKRQALNGPLSTAFHIHFRELQTPDVLEHEITLGTLNI